MYRLKFTLILAALVAAGCNVNEAPPPNLIDDTPVITIGEKTPPKGDYILYVPQDQAVPVQLSVTGSFLAKSTSMNAKIQVQRDLYIFRQWSSFDGRTWQPSHALFDTRMRAGLTHSGAMVNVQFNRAQGKQDQGSD